MKTSNKLIIGFILGFLLVSTAVHLVLYSEYRKGHFVTEKQMHEEDYIKFALPAPRVISFNGTIWVNLVPADHFALELPRKEEDPEAGVFEKGPGASYKAISYQQQGDTLLVTGSVTIPIHRPFSGWPYRHNLPQVTIYGSVLNDVLLNNGQLYLQGANDSTISRSARLTIRNSTLWVGMQYETRRPVPREFFDSLDIRATKSIIVLNTSASIHHLQAELKDSSVITDQYSRLANTLIRSTPDSRVDLTGDALKHNQVIIH